VPELSAVTQRWIHEPHVMTPDDQSRSGCRIGVDYPAPLVDHRLARQEYLDLGKQQVTR
jgi:deoxyribodipyrimidine photo-lyase